jgi:ubiquitin-protein ligase E3 C
MHLQTLLSPAHLNAWLKATQHNRGALPDLVSWHVNLCIVGPTWKDKILSTLLLYGGGGLVHKIYRHLYYSSLSFTLNLS